MYEPRNLVWLVAVFLICVALFAVQTIRIRRAPQSPGAPRSASNSAVLLWLLAATTLLAVFAIRWLGTNRMRDELRSVAPASVSKLELFRDSLRKEITSADEIAKLLSLLQSLKGISPHHSHPNGEVDVILEFNGQRRHYRVGRDSERAEEFWITVVNDSSVGSAGYEIGRVESADFGRFLEELLRGDGR